jgi:peroxin-7
MRIDTMVHSDMSVILWDLQPSLVDPLVRRFEHHSEFVVGLDFNLFVEGQLATCSWDETVDIIPL